MPRRRLAQTIGIPSATTRGRACCDVGARIATQLAEECRRWGHEQTPLLLLEGEEHVVHRSGLVDRVEVDPVEVHARGGCVRVRTAPYGVPARPWPAASGRVVARSQTEV